MGGRGSSSGFQTNQAKGLEITFNGETTTYYFDSANGQNYYRHNLGGTPELTPQNLSLADFKQRAESNGATVKVISESEYQTRHKAYWDERANRPDWELGMGVPGGNRAYTRQARTNRLNSRTMRKK